MPKVHAHIQIRNAEEKDAAIVSSIHYRAFFEFKPLYTERAFRETTISAEEVLGRMREGPVLLAMEEREAVGTVSMVQTKEGIYIRGMAVVPEARGKKVGWQLLEAVEAFARANGEERLFFYTCPFLHAAIHLYNCFGFIKIGSGYDDFYGTKSFEMEKFIKPDYKI